MAIDDIHFLHVDPSLLVVNKPAGLLSVPGRGLDKQDCMSARVLKVYPDALVVHRLDMATSGLMVFARSPAVQRKLNHAFACREVEKRYVAVVDGIMQTDGRGVIDLPISLDWPNRPRRVIDYQVGKHSLTHWRVQSYDKPQNTTRIDLQPVTGRSHQLRIHLCAMGHAILGDTLYASEMVQHRSDRLLLHAHRIAMRHPDTGEPVQFLSAVPF